ncbi:MAG: TonB-dependent receptor [bacterium]|nr:TonB-dependent receptor [bacterium]
MSISTAGKKVQRVSEVPASVVVITRADIESHGYSSLEEIVASVPGYFILDNWAYSYSVPGVRGFFSQSSTGVIVLINGVSQLRKGIESYSIRESSVPVECIDRIEIIRGPMSVMYGTGAFYGVINIITDEVLESGEGCQVAVAMGSLRSKYASFTLSGNRSDIQYSVNGGYRYCYGMNVPLHELSSNLAAWQIVNSAPDTDGRLEGWDRYLDITLRVAPLTFKFTGLEMMQEVVKSLGVQESGDPIENLKLNLMLEYDAALSDDLHVNANIRYNVLNNLEIARFWNTSYYGNEDLRARSYEAEVRAHYSPDDQIDITAGLTQNAMTEYYQVWDYTEFSDYYNNQRRTLSDSDDITTYAAFLQGDYSPTPRVKLVAGCRLERMTDYGMELSYGSDSLQHGARTEVYGKYRNEGLVAIPRAAVILTMNESNVVKLFYGEAIKRPAFSENIHNLVDLGKFGFLESERIRTYELNYTTALLPRSSVSISLFRNELDNLIGKVYTYTDLDDLISYQANGGELVTNGAEMIIDISPHDDFDIELNGSYQDTRDKREGYEDIAAAYSPKFLGYANLLFKKSDVNIALSGRYVDEMESFWDGPPGEDLGGGRIGAASESYFLLGSYLRFSNLFTPGLYVDFKVSNLLDEKFNLPTSEFNKWIDKGIPGRDREFQIKFGYMFM